MDGVTILQVIEHSARPTWAEAIIMIAGIIGAIAFIVSLFLIISSEFKPFIIFFIIGIICIVILKIVIGNTEEVTDITYRVLVDSTVDMNEFFSKYELIRTEGLIYVVKSIN